MEKLLGSIRSQLSTLEGWTDGPALGLRGELQTLVSPQRAALIFLRGEDYQVSDVEPQLALIAQGVDWPVVGVVLVFVERPPLEMAKAIAANRSRQFPGRTIYPGSLTPRLMKIHKDMPLPDGLRIRDDL